jgi:hypothetical protein
MTPRMTPTYSLRAERNGATQAFALSKIEQLVGELAAALKHDDVQTDAMVGRLKAVTDRLLTIVADDGIK